MSDVHRNLTGDESGQIVDEIILPLTEGKCLTFEGFRQHSTEITKKHLPYVLPADIIPCFKHGEQREIAIRFEEDDSSGIWQKQIFCFADLSIGMAASMECMRHRCAAAIVLASIRKETLTIWLSESSSGDDARDGVINYDDLVMAGYGQQLKKAYEALGRLEEFRN